MARYELKLPQMGESVEEATVSSWLKKVGDTVQVDDILVEVATDKVDSEIPSEVSGIIMDILTPEKTVVKVGQLMAIIETEVQQPTIAPISMPESLQPSVTEVSVISTQEEKSPLETKEEELSDEQKQIIQQVPYLPTSVPTIASKEESGMNTFYSPLVRTIAKEENISQDELASIKGTGAEGRVTKYDILRYIEARKGIVQPREEKEPIPVQQSVEETPVSTQENLSRESSIPTDDKIEVHDPQVNVKEQSIPSQKEPMISSLAHPISESQVQMNEAQTQVQEGLPNQNRTEKEVLATSTLEQEKVPIPEIPVQEEVKYPDIADFMKTFTATHTKDESPQKSTKEEVKKVSTTEVPNNTLQIPENKPEEKPTTYTPSPVDENVEVIEMTRMGKLIANYMSESKKIAAHATSFIEVDVTRIWNWRNKYKKQFEVREGEKLTFTPIFIEAVAKALRDFPLMNISTDGERIFKKKNINIGMATALPNGDLIVPVIKNADQLSLVGLAKNVNDLAKRARENKLKPEEVKGGTYTVTNIGAFGNLFGTPILNQPESGILAIGAIQKVPAVVETPEGDVIAIRYKLMLSHSFDHRVINGALGGMFVQRVAQYLENWDNNREV
ncbi:2-oxo acid dehydrogenase subunit E2 [Capnocytophaga sp. oral taxon 338]|jgi:Pyruvate/2-oxoglutarate dehydrogenase complex, dihydrolipoamide acyltransferase (E2) component, and related enzymes|uniref:2-oxo acid dehydrogenase subunit E2 n=1 Tax=Capnocytophaga sp. oral taxon 338 TaxID=710239 RepID=UPI000202F4F0|nr:2-oxoglutarate dehydrogenase E2, dihydrolipoamide acetyltransferase [Capnocytophaga sp. oral taxon 338 str. F0234]